MGDENEQDRDHAVRERIASLIQSNERSGKKQLTEAELQALKNAASRLDQLLANAAEAETQELKTAVSRLDELLSEIAKGKDAVSSVRRRTRSDSTE